MGKQIRFLQSINDIKEFVSNMKKHELKVYLKKCYPIMTKDNFLEVNDIDDNIFGTQLYISTNNANDIVYYNKYYRTYHFMQDSVFEYSTPTLYKKKFELDIIDEGRIWIDIGAYPNIIYERFEMIRKWIKNNYIFKNGLYIGPYIEKHIKDNRIIASAGCGRYKIINKDMCPTFTKTWLSNCKYINGEWVDM